MRLRQAAFFSFPGCTPGPQRMVFGRYGEPPERCVPMEETGATVADFLRISILSVRGGRGSRPATFLPADGRPVERSATGVPPLLS